MCQLLLMTEEIVRLKELYRKGGFTELSRGVADFLIYHTPMLSKVGVPIREYGFRHGTPLIFSEMALKALPEDDTGTNIFELDWDVAIVLDTCRPEWLDKIKSDYDFLDDVETIRSVGGRTSEWVSRTFRKATSVDEPIVYIYGSKYGDATSNIENINPMRVECDRFKYPPANQITDRALESIYNNKDAKVVVHYAQPHFPVFENDDESSREKVNIINGTNQAMQKSYVTSGRDIEYIEGLHIKNLQYVMEEVENLINSIKHEDIILTADHGQSLGEKFIFGHPHGCRHDAVRNVPLANIQP